MVDCNGAHIGNQFKSFYNQKMDLNVLESFTDVLEDPDEICDSQPISLSSVENFECLGSDSAVKFATNLETDPKPKVTVLRPAKGTGRCGEFRSIDEIDDKYRSVFSYPFFNLVQSRVIDDVLYSDKSMVVCAPTGSGKTVLFEMAIVHLLMELEDNNESHDFKIIYMAPVKALCTERLTEWYPKFTKLGLLCIEVTGDTDVDFSQLKPYRIIITTPEKWDMLTRRWRDHRQLVEMVKLILIDEVHILNDCTRGPVLEAVVSRMKTIETSVQSTHRIEQLQLQYQGAETSASKAPNIRFIAVSATVGNPEDVAAWLGTEGKPAVHYKFGDECRPVRLKRVVEGYHCAGGASMFKFDIVLNYKLWPIIQRYHNGKPTLIFCNTRKSVALTAETLSKIITMTFNEEQKARLIALASTIKNKKLQMLVLSGVGCHHAGLLYEERTNIEQAFRNRHLPILITTTTLAMGVNLPAHLVIIKNTQQYVNGAYQEYSISTILQMVGRAGRPQFDTEATAVIMTRSVDKARYQALVGGSEPLQSYLHKRLPENLNSEAALGTVSDVAQCVQWLRSTFLSVRATKEPKRYLGLPPTAPSYQITKKIEELCVKAMNGLASAGLITMDEACCIESTEAGRLMSTYYLDLETMKHIMKIDGSETLERLLWIVCESHELADMYLRIDERRCLNALNRNNTGPCIRFPMKGKITTRQMKLNCMIQASLGCLPIPDPSLNQEATKVIRTADRVCKCVVAYVTRPPLISQQPKYYSAILNSIILAKCVAASLWENSQFVSKQLRGIGPTFSALLAGAGKCNFMLLEESHPRDLERIMNKGPPAGNILRKQISLLPKYEITATPVDEKEVTIELKLLNCHNLAENMDHLTAGPTHRSYIIVGDSENTLLLLSSFKDKDLISVYDGKITRQIRRKYGFEHKIFVHCVSSTIAGIDAYCEYVFKDIEPQVHQQQQNLNEDLYKNTPKRQTIITDTFTERKRKNTDNEIAHFREKKKRESAFLDKFKNLKDSFGKTTKVLKNDLKKSSIMAEKIQQDLTNFEKPVKQSILPIQNINTDNIHDMTEKYNKSCILERETYEINDDDFENDDFIDDYKIENILNRIECEISKANVPYETITRNYENSSTAQKPVTSKQMIANKVSNVSTYSNIDILDIHDMTEKSNKSCILERETYKINDDDFENDDFIDDYKIENILHQIECEISKANEPYETITRNYENRSTAQKPATSKQMIAKKVSKISTYSNIDNYKPMNHIKKRGKNAPKKSNFSFIERLEKNAEISDEDKPKAEEQNSFSDDIRTHIEKYLLKTKSNVKASDRQLKDLIQEEPVTKVDTEPIITVEYSFKESNIPIDETPLRKPKGNETENSPITIRERIPNEVSLLNHRMKSIDSTKDEIYCHAQDSDDSELPAVKIGKKDSINGERNIKYIENTRINKIDKKNCDVLITEIGNKTIRTPLTSKNSVTDNELNDEPDSKKTKHENVESVHVPFINLERDMDDLQEESVSTIAYQNTQFSSSLKESNENTSQAIVLEPIDKQNVASAIETPSKEIYNHLQVAHTLDFTKVQDFPVLELCKNYIKELPLELDIKEVCKNVNPKELLKKDTITELKKLVNLSDTMNKSPEVKEKLNLSTKEPHKSTMGVFNPPFKHLPAEASINQVPFIQPDTNDKVNVLLETKENLSQTRNDIEIPKIRIEKREVTRFNARSNQLTNLQLNYKFPMKIENQESNQIESIINVGSSSNANVPCYVQQNFDKLPYDPSKAASHLFNSEEQQKLPNVENPVTTSGHVVTQQRYGDKMMMPNSPNFHEKQICLEFEPFNECVKSKTTTEGSNICEKDKIVKSNNNSSNNDQRHYINQYSLSSNQIGITTQETADHVVRVIRKMRIDLDVTEIVSEIEIKKSNVQDVINTTSYVVEQDNDANISELKSLIESQNKLTQDLLSSISQIEETPIENTSNYRCNKEPSNNKQDVANKENLCDVEESKKEITLFSKYKIQDDILERKSNNAESILQKYSNVYRQRNKNTKKKLNETKKDKQNRPFKISDLHRLNPSALSEAFTEKPKAINVTERFNLLEPRDKRTQFHNKLFNVCGTINTPIKLEVAPEYHKTEEHFSENHQHADIEKYENLLHCNPSFLNDLEEKATASDIDQTMFDPKKLLLCFSKEEPEDFIPPPPEFSDYLNTTDTNTDVNLPTDCYDPMVWEDSASREDKHNTSIFNGSQPELASSKEIETWNLSQDKSRKMYATPGLNPYLFTMMHNTELNVETSSKATETWNLSQKGKDHCNMYAPPGLSPYSFKIMRKNKEQTAKVEIKKNPTQPSHKKLEQFKFIHRKKFNL